VNIAALNQNNLLKMAIVIFSAVVLGAGAAVVVFGR
jgi:hypothetical protein